MVGLTSSFALLPFGLFIELGIYRNYKHLLKKEKGINSELEFLKKQVIVEKEKLNTLKNIMQLYIANIKTIVMVLLAIQFHMMLLRMVF